MFPLDNADLQWFAHSMLKVMVRVSECLTVEALLQEHMAFLVQSWFVRLVAQFLLRFNIVT